MSFDADEELLQDFLVEAGEILETLSEQLVRLEKEPDDLQLLNAIFRGFHTVKGGAGFLKLDALVEVCHLGENIFDKLRNQALRADASLMDLVLRVLDIVNEMFDEVRGGHPPTHADPAFLRALQDCSDGKSSGVPIAASAQTPAAVPAPTPASATPVSTANAVATEQAKSDEITDAEFEALLDSLHGAGGAPAAKAPEKPAAVTSSSLGSSDEITDDEFEKLLDQLHGSGNGPGASTAMAAANAASSAKSDEITEDEFEKLLDQLHSGEKSPGAGPSVSTTPMSVKPAADGLISDNEFEALLDQIHGIGKGPTEIKAAEAITAAAVVSVAPPVAHASSPVPSPVVAAAPRAEAKQPAAAAAADSQQADTTVRVDTKKLDDIMNMVGELVLVRNRLLVLAQNSGNESIAKAVQNLDVVTGDLQNSVMQTRMQPIKKVFGRFPRVVRDLARSMKKEINLELVGEDTDLDKNMVEALADPLVHLVRNAIDHGIEMPDDRADRGKDRAGKVVLSAAQEGDHILLSIRDDGRGMDPVILKQKAVEKGLLDQEQADRLSDVEAFNLIFAPGFSTKAEVSDISGRGVGMDVVKTRITQLNGQLNIDSRVGEGSTISIKLPLTLAILPTLMVTVNEQAFALPLASVNEIFHLDLTKTNVVDGQITIMVRGKALPLFYLEDWLVRGATRGNRRKEGFVVLVQVGTQRVGFVVDGLIGQQEVVIKPLGKSLQGTPGMAGATITSDGGIALILDIPALLKRYARRAA